MSKLEQGGFTAPEQPAEQFDEVAFAKLKEFFATAKFNKNSFKIPSPGGALSKMSDEDIQEQIKNNVSFLEQNRNLFAQAVVHEKTSEVIKFIIELSSQNTLVQLDENGYADQNYETDNEAEKFAFKIINELQPKIEEQTGELNVIYKALLLKIHQNSFYRGTAEQKALAIKYLLDHLEVIKDGLKNPDWVIRDMFLNSCGTLYHSREMERSANSIVKNVLQDSNLPVKNILADWNESGLDIDHRVKINLGKILELETRQPGSTKFLHEKFGISIFGRYPEEILLDMIKNYDDEEKPYGLIVLPKNDHNGAFYNDRWIYSKLYQQLNGEFLLRIVEAESKQDIARALIRLDKKYNPEAGSGHKISLLILGGHGQEDSIQFGGDDARHQLHIQDLTGEGVKRTGKFFEENPTIILSSCSTGIAGGIGQELSRVMGAKVIAPEVPTSPETFSAKKEAGKFVFDATFKKKEKALYQRGSLEV